MKKKFIIIIIGLVIILGVIAALYFKEYRIEKEYIEEINSGNYSIECKIGIYTNIPLVVNSRIIEVDADGHYRVTEKVYGANTTIYTEGDCDTDMLKEFATNAIKNDIYKMEEIVDVENIADGGFIKFILTIGEDEIVLEGINRTLDDEELDKIIDEFMMLLSDFKFTSYIKSSK